MDSQASNLTNPDANTGLADALQGGNVAQRLATLSQLRGNPRTPLIIAVAVLIAVVTGLVLWSRAPDYRVLYSNLSDRDGGAIVSALQQANIPYKFASGGAAILVPSESVNEMRLRLASQGLPKGGSAGFELMDNQKFGISQFAEQVNYQRALEGELEKTIGSISSVREARVHLAVPKHSVFVRDREAPTASVMVNLYPGRALDESQTIAITHMVASAVPEMPVKNVTIVDQDGNLLTQAASSASGLDASQFKFVQQIESNTQKRIDAILAPLFGAGNARSQVSADVDFSKIEQTAETYGPNGDPQKASIRSQQTSSDTQSSSTAGGVPGALSNQPPQPASAPIDAAASGASATPPTNPISQRKDSTTNYELDKTIRHIEQPVGTIKRLSVAVVINNMPVADAKGKVTMKPVPPELLTKVDQLVKDAMGYDEKRGDSVNVVNSAFSTVTDAYPELPWYRTPDMISLIKQIAQYVGIAAIAAFLYFAMVRPAMRRAFPSPAESAPADAADPLALDGRPTDPSKVLEDDGIALDLSAFESTKHKFEKDLAFARTIAKDDPKMLATVVKSWVED